MEMEHTQDRSREYTLEEGVLRGVMPDAANFYKASPARVLALFVAAAARNCAISLTDRFVHPTAVRPPAGRTAFFTFFQLRREPHAD